MANGFNITIKPTTRGPSARGLNIQRVFAHHGVRVQARTNIQSIFPDLRTDSLALAQRLGQLLMQARNLSLEFDQGVRFGPRGLAKFLNHAVKAADRLGQDFIAYSARVEDDVIQASPRSFSGETLQRKRLAGFETALKALTIVDDRLVGIDSKSQAEAVVARALFEFFEAVELKAYNVSQEGMVRISHSWVKHPEVADGVVRVPGKDLDSHFSEWSFPCSTEAVYELIEKKPEMVLIEEPETDPRVVSETRPCVLLAERVQGKLTRIYKIDWQSSWDHKIYARTIKGLFDRLAGKKASLTSEKIEKFFNQIQRVILDSEESLEAKLEEISQQIAGFFEINGSKERPQRVTIMLHDKDADSLVTRVIWDRDDGAKLVSFFSGKDSKRIGRRIFDGELCENLRRVGDWDGEVVEWGRGGNGSLLAAVVKGPNRKLGVITVSSDRENAFTNEQKMLLERLAGNIAPTFENVIKHLDQLKVHESYGDLSAKNSNLVSKFYFNRQYLIERLEADLIALRESGKPVSVLFADIDHFKALNEVWTHAEVDYVLAEMFSKIVDRLRDGELYRVGGEELVIRIPGDINEAAAVAKRMLSIGKEPLTVYIPYTSWEEARARANDLRKAILQSEMIKQGVVKKIHEKAFEHPDHGIVSVEVLSGRGGDPVLKVKVQKTLSIGIAQADVGSTGESVIGKADTAESLAKHGGRNRAAFVKEQTVEFVIPD